MVARSKPKTVFADLAAYKGVRRVMSRKHEVHARSVGLFRRVTDFLDSVPVVVFKTAIVVREESGSL
jgi:hypothetical protein